MDEITAKLLSEGRKLSNDPEDTKLLRQLQDWAREGEIRTKGRERLILFFLDAFISDLFMNLSGMEFPDNTEEVRRDFYKKLGHSLEKMATTWKDEDPAALFSLSGIVDDYFELLSILDSIR